MGISLPQALSKSHKDRDDDCNNFFHYLWGDEHDGDTVWIVAFEFG